MRSPEEPRDLRGSPVSTARVALRVLMVLMLAAIVVLAVLLARREGTGRPPLPQEPAELPVLAEVPELSLVRSDGRAVTRADLAGTPWVADFVFTRCVTLCPILTSRMLAVGEGLEEGRDFRRVSVTVDPAFDTPEVLREYQASRRLPETWWWLTGEPEAVLKLVREGFLLGVEPNPGDTGDPILHSTRLVLVDGAHRIRGYYDALDDEALQRLKLDLRRLVGTTD